MKKVTLIIPCIFFICLSIGCRKFVELGPPDTLLVSDNVFANDATANGAMTGIYAEIVDRGQLIPYYIPLITGLSGDELETKSETFRQVYVNALSPVDAPSSDIWTTAYSWIFQSNLVYAGCDKSESLTPAVKKQLMAEAAFVRAWWYFYLVNLWGDVPYTTSIVADYNSHLAKTPANEVYQKIIADLKYAQENLNEKYVAANSIETGTDRVRPNKSTATALLARVYLYTKDYTSAEQQSSILINDKDNFDLVELNNVFLKNSKEAIWQLMKPLPNPTEIVTPEGYGFVLTAAPSGNLFISNSFISKFLLDAFDDTDQRKSSWIGKITDTEVTPNKDYFFPNKYKIQTGTSYTEVSTVFRLAEQYLIRAEARAQLNNLPGSIADVDMIRDRAGIDKIALTNAGISRDDLLVLILKERQRELFTEWGHRWMDLKRTGNIDAVMKTVAVYKNTTWSNYKQFWPIAKKELDKNTNIRQNSSY